MPLLKVVFMLYKTAILMLPDCCCCEGPASAVNKLVLLEKTFFAYFNFYNCTETLYQMSMSHDYQVNATAHEKGVA